MGAAIQAAIIAGADVGAVLVDITPHSLGIKLPGRLHRGFDFPFRFAPIIHRNTPLPASRSEVFYTVHDNQNEVEIDVYQGENDDVRHNHRVGKFRIAGPGAACRPAIRLVVQLDLNLDGMLEGVGPRKGDRACKSRSPSRTPWPLRARRAATQARERLEQLWERRGGSVRGRGRARTRSRATWRRRRRCRSWCPGRAKASARRCRPGRCWRRPSGCSSACAPEDQAEVERLMTKVRTALTDRQWDQVTAACNELADMLFYLEDA